MVSIPHDFSSSYGLSILAYSFVWWHGYNYSFWPFSDSSFSCLPNLVFWYTLLPVLYRINTDIYINDEFSSGGDIIWDHAGHYFRALSSSYDNYLGWDLTCSPSKSFWHLGRCWFIRDHPLHHNLEWFRSFLDWSDTIYIIRDMVSYTFVKGANCRPSYIWRTGSTPLSGV